jgi:hypothetical protein
MATSSSNTTSTGGFEHGIPQAAETPLNLTASSGCCGTASQTSTSGCCGEPAIQNTASTGKSAAQGCCGEPTTAGATTQAGGCCGEPTSGLAATQTGCCN